MYLIHTPSINILCYTPHQCLDDKKTYKYLADENIFIKAGFTRYYIMKNCYWIHSKRSYIIRTIMLFITCCWKIQIQTKIYTNVDKYNQRTTCRNSYAGGSLHIGWLRWRLPNLLRPLNCKTLYARLNREYTSKMFTIKCKVSRNKLIKM